MTKRYFGEWANAEGRYFDDLQGFDALVDDFDISNRDDVEDANVIFASYGREDYDGSAFVLFQRDGKLYEVHGSHCSCMGLEGQWKPEETTWAEIDMRFMRLLDSDAEEALAALVEANRKNNDS